MEIYNNEKSDANSDDFVADILAEHFNKELSGLDTAKAGKYLADRISTLDTPTKVKIVSLVGGAGAGKSTLAGELSTSLKALGLRTDVISTDAFVVGTREERRGLEKEGPLSKYDFDYMRRIIQKIQDAEEGVRVPTYDEATGLAIAAGEENFTHKVPKIECLIIEGDFDEVQTPDLRIYLHVSDRARYQNRVRRDLQKRGESDQQKIADNFNLRQKSQHFPHTLPAATKANMVIEARLKDEEYTFDIYERRV